jgi:hypothetical protein
MTKLVMDNSGGTFFAEILPGKGAEDSAPFL